MCDKYKNIHTTVQNTIQHETVDLKTPLQDLQLKAFSTNNPYSPQKMQINIDQVTDNITCKEHQTLMSCL